MYQKERLEDIMNIVKRYGYVTVKYLVGELHYSNATINRDLNILEKQKKIRRSYGGVEFVEKSGVALPFRYHKMRSEKLKIGKRAAEFVKDGDVIFIDASTTAEYMAEFLRDKQDLTVITNNIALVMRLCEYNVRVICLGGEIVEMPCMLGGELAVESAMKYRVNKMFFASTSISEKGEIMEMGDYYLLHRIMLGNAQEIYYLADHEKIVKSVPSAKILCNLHSVKGVISDYEFPQKLQSEYAATQFIQV